LPAAMAKSASVKNVNKKRAGSPLPKPDGPRGTGGETIERAVVGDQDRDGTDVRPIRRDCTGVTAQVAADGAPLQLSETDWLNPPSGLRLRLYVAVCPAVTVVELGKAEREKSAPLPLRVPAGNHLGRYQ